MHKIVLSNDQQDLLPLIKNFDDFYLAGGTALALQIGHRKSIDFDLFSYKEINQNKIISQLNRSKISKTIVDNEDQLTFIYDGVKLTFLHYPFEVNEFVTLESGIRTVKPISIATMKAYALGRRAKWKDYVDLYFITRMESLEKIINQAEKLFGKLFNEKLFREQLTYYEDIDYSEKVNYLIPHPPSDDEIKSYLTNTAISI
jgi:hypothetical protein